MMAFEKPKYVMILAGGLGTRLRSVISDVPKPMAPVQGKPFLEHVLNYWKKQGINNFILCVGYKSELIVEYFGDEFNGSKIFYSIENIPLGTGGSVIKAVKDFHLKDPFILVNGDTFFEVNLVKVHNFASENRADWCFSLFESKDKSRYLSVALKPNGSINFFLDRNQQAASNIISPKDQLMINSSYGNGGVYWINPTVFKSLLNQPITNSSLERDIFHRGVALGQNFYGLVCSGLFIDIGLPADYNRAQFIDAFRTK